MFMTNLLIIIYDDSGIGLLGYVIEFSCLYVQIFHKAIILFYGTYEYAIIHK